MDIIFISLFPDYSCFFVLINQLLNSATNSRFLTRFIVNLGIIFISLFFSVSGLQLFLPSYQLLNSATNSCFLTFKVLNLIWITFEFQLFYFEFSAVSRCLSTFELSCFLTPRLLATCCCPFRLPSFSFGPIWSQFYLYTPIHVYMYTIWSQFYCGESVRTVQSTFLNCAATFLLLVCSPFHVQFEAAVNQSSLIWRWCAPPREPICTNLAMRALLLCFFRFKMFERVLPHIAHGDCSSASANLY